MKKRNKALERKIAKERINELFRLAEEVFKEEPRRSHRYVHIARRIGMKFNMRLPRQLKRKFCRHCYHYLVPGINCRIRTRNKKVVYYCADCKGYMRFPYIKEKKGKLMGAVQTNTR